MKVAPRKRFSKGSADAAIAQAAGVPVTAQASPRAEPAAQAATTSASSASARAAAQPGTAVSGTAPVASSSQPPARLAHTRAPQGLLGRLFRRSETDAQAAARRDAEAQRKLIAHDVLSQPEKGAAAKPSRPASRDREKPFLAPQKKKRKRRAFKQLLLLAGLPDDMALVYQKVFRIAFGLTMFTLLVAVLVGIFLRQTFSNPAELGPFLQFALALCTFGLLGFVIIVGLGYAVYVDLCINKRRREIETVFPDYLQLAAANLSAGMTVDRALWSAVRPRFGVLAKEMEDVAKKTMTGYDLEKSLKEFGDKYDSLVIKRSVDLICEGSRTGGRMADILNKIAINIQENDILQKEMAANVMTYVIFISFASVLAAPFLFALATQLLIVIKQIAGTIAIDPGSSQGVGLSLSPNAVTLDDFRIFSYTVLSVTSILSACIVSVIRKGTVKDGFRLIPGYWAVAMLIYIVSSWGLGFLFSGFLAG